MDVKKKRQVDRFAAEMRIAILETLATCGFGHIGGSMSIVELVALLYEKVLRYDANNPKWEERDRVILSKGHAGPTLYAALALKGILPKEALKTLNAGGSMLPSHSDKNYTPGVDATMGSLGQGLSAALGQAMGFRLRGFDNYVYAILGDGETQEGQIWEAAMAAPHFKADHLIAFIDNNGLQLDGKVKNVLGCGSYRERFELLGWFAQEVDGHDVSAIDDAIAAAKAQSGKPSMIVLDTVKGKGVSFAEGIERCHFMTFDKEQIAAEIAAHKARLED